MKYIGAVMDSGFVSDFGEVQRSVKAFGSAIDVATRKIEEMGRSVQGLRVKIQSLDNLSAATAKAISAQNRLSEAVDRHNKILGQRKKIGEELAKTKSTLKTWMKPVEKSVKIHMERETAETGLKQAMMQKDGSMGRFNQINAHAMQLGLEQQGNTNDYTRLATNMKLANMSDDAVLQGGMRTIASFNVLFGKKIEDISVAKGLMQTYKLKDTELSAGLDAVQKVAHSVGLSLEDIEKSQAAMASPLQRLHLTGLQNQQKIYALEGMAIHGGVGKSAAADGMGEFLDRLAQGPKAMQQATAAMSIEMRQMMQKSGVVFNLFDKDGSLKDMHVVVGELEANFNKVKAKYGDRAALNMMDAVFGKQGGQIATAAAQGGGAGFVTMQTRMGNQPSLDQRAQLQVNTLAVSMDNLHDAVIEVGNAFGATLAPDINTFAQVAKDVLLNTVLPFIQKHPTLIKSVVAFGVGLTGLRMTLLLVRYAITMVTGPLALLRTIFARFQLAHDLKQGGSVFQRLRSAITSVGKSAGSLRQKLLSFGSRLAGVGKNFKVFNKGRSALGLLQKAFSTIGRTAIAPIKKIVQSFGLITKVVKPLFRVFSSLGRGFSALGKGRIVLNLLRQGIIAVGRAFLMTPIGLVALAIGAAAFLIYKYWKPIKSFFIGLWDSVKAKFEAGMKFFKDLPAKFSEFGRNIIDGLVKSFTEGISRAVNAVGEFASKIINKAKSVLGINSPSRVFKSIGGSLMEGMHLGLDLGADKPVTAIGLVAERLQQKFKSRSGTLTAQLNEKMQLNAAEFAQHRYPAGHDSSAVTINFNPTIQVNGNADRSVIQQALALSQREFEQMYRRMMQAKELRSY
ncbi:hypothetical protein [Snodgrassella sp.]|uniref:phage tail tape measure protein n=1 Tax=Snodgrassella sp. TaxID=2815304 RepID=UPI00258DCFCA|nr:hypothetical protein [Snodgrassella sp.]